MRPEVMCLDVLEVAGFRERREVPVEFAHPEMEVRVVGANGAQVALEVHYIHGVEADLQDAT